MRVVRGANFQGKPEAYVSFGSQIQAILADLKVVDPTSAKAIEAAQPSP